MQIQDLKNAVIVPWDFSTLSRQALDKAYDMVDPSLIHVVHVTEYPTAYEYGVVWDTVGEDIIVDRLNVAFRQAVEDQPRFENVRFQVLFGNPGDRVSDYAHQQAADLILIASHGRTGISRFLLGSVAERILRSSPCPVIVLREKTESVEQNKSVGVTTTTG